MRFAAITQSIVVLLASAVAGAQAPASAPLATALPSISAAGPPGQDLVFEAATIKPSDPAACCASTFNENGRRFQTTNTYLRWLLMWAYGLQTDQIIGAPAWIDFDRYNVAGELEGTKPPTDHQWRAAVQKLLVDRFQMQFHWEKREMRAYAVVAAKGGPKLVKLADNAKYVPWTGLGGDVGQTMHVLGQNVTIAEFFAQVQRVVLDHPVVDQTGLTGRYYIQLAFTREDPAALGTTELPDNAAPNLFTAVEEQLGLKLKATKAPVDVLVIDHVKKPSPD